MNQDMKVFFLALTGALSVAAATDHSVDEFPRLAGEADDAPRFQRAVDACRGGGLLTIHGFPTHTLPWRVGLHFRSARLFPI